jgi:hypothetical protein
VPTTATAKNYLVSAIQQAPGDIWIIGTAPTDSAVRLTLDLATGTPDTTAHPSSICLGLTESGITTNLTGKYVDIDVDQADAAVDRVLSATEMMIEAELTQQSVDLLQNALSTGTYATQVSPGYKQLTVGGTLAVPQVCVAAISPKRGTALWNVAVLYRCTSVGGLQALWSKSKKSSHKIQFTGLADLTRTAGKQIGVYYETL